MFDIEKSAALKFSQPIMDRARGFCPWLTDEQFDHFCKLMKNRLVVGEARYEGPKWMYFDRDQEEVIGKNWRHGYTFYDWNPAFFARAAARKMGAYRKTGNTEVLVDVANYLVFTALTADRDFDVVSWGVYRVMEEFFSPLHPNAHYRTFDQDIDGPETSGSATLDPAVSAHMRKVAR